MTGSRPSDGDQAPSKTKCSGRKSRPRRAGPNSREAFSAVALRRLLEPMRVTVNGRGELVPALEAILIQLLSKAVAGDRQARRLLLKFQRHVTVGGRVPIELVYLDEPTALSPALREMAEAPETPRSGEAEGPTHG